MAQAICFGDSYRIQTCNLLIRSQMLYSIELRSRPLSCDCECKVNPFSRNHQIFFLLFFAGRLNKKTRNKQQVSANL